MEDGESEALSVLRVVVEHADFAGKETRAERSSDPSCLWVVVDDGLFCLPQHALGLVKELLGKDLAALLASPKLAQAVLEARDATEPETQHQSRRKEKKKKKTQHNTTQHKRTTRTTEEGVLSLRHPSLVRVERGKTFHTENVEKADK